MKIDGIYLFSVLKNANSNNAIMKLLHLKKKQVEVNNQS